MIDVLCNSVYFITCVYPKCYPEKGSTGFSAQLQDSPWHKCLLTSSSSSAAQAEITTASQINVAEGDTVQQGWPLACLAIFLCSQKCFLRGGGTSGHRMRRPMWLSMDPQDMKSSLVPVWATLDNQTLSRSPVHELPLAYGKMHQDDRFTALFKGVGSYWYHFSSQIIKSSVVGKGSEVHLVTRMLDELGGQNFSFS